MKHEYYQYNAEEILSKGPKFPLIIMKDNAEVFKSMADEMQIRSLSIMQKVRRLYLSVL